jgi:putative transcriptional regulator
MVPNVSTRGRLLVATPPLDDPNFDRTVVYMLEHHDVGAVGVVLNRPGTDLDDVEMDDEAEILAAWFHFISPPSAIFVGGPVGDDSLIAVAAGRGRHEAGWGTVTEPLGTVDLSWSPDEVAEHIDALRMFQGYSGWGPGQLEDEIAAGGWMVFDAQPEDVFTNSPATLWRDVVRRQGGHLKWIAESPDDLSAN